MDNNTKKLTIDSNQQLPRKQLNLLLEEGINRGIVSVIAGPGYGKTRSVSNYLTENNLRVLWFQLTPLDNIPARFWKGLTQSAESQLPALAERMKQLDFPDTILKVDQFFHIAFNQIYPGERLVCVLDDLHLIEDEQVLWFIEHFVNAQIENLSIILISRTIPPLHYVSDVELKHLLHITSENLIFTKEEVKEYMEMLHYNFNELQIDRLYEMTSGWAFSIHLFGLALSRRSELGSSITDDIAPIVFHLIDHEIFMHYNPSEQKLMAKLALLDTYEADLIKQIAGKEQKALLELLQSNMFISYNPYISTYQIHFLFIQFLHNKNILSEKEIKDTYYKIAKWYEEYERPIEALVAYKKAKSYENCWRIFLTLGAQYTPKSTATFLLKQLDELPQLTNYDYTRCQFVKANMLQNNGDFETADAILNELLDDLLAAENRTSDETELLGEIYILKGILSFSLRTLDLAQHFQNASKYLPHGSKKFISTSKMMDSNYAAVMRNPEPGELKLMQDLFFDAIPYTSAVLGNKAYARAYLCKAEGAYFTGDLKTAAKYALQTVYKGQQTDNYSAFCMGYFILMRTSFAQGNYDAIMDYCEKLEKHCAPLRDTRDYPLIADLAYTWFFCRLKLFERIPKWIRDDNLNEEIIPPASIGRGQIGKAHYLLYQGKYIEVSAFLENQIPIFYETKNWIALIAAYILQAIATYYAANPKSALKYLEEAYKLSSGNQLDMMFIEFGNFMRTLIKGVTPLNSSVIPLEWLELIQRKSNTYAKRNLYITNEYYKNAGQNYSPEFNLTAKELEILQALCQGLTRDEIALGYNLSINTVKSKLQTIYSKLGALNIADAVRIAVSSNLVS